MEAAHPTVRPDEFDVVINDIRNEDVANIGAMLEVQDLSDSTGPGAISCMDQASAYLYRSL